MTLEEKIRLGTPVALEQMLEARERRAARQRALLAGGGGSLVCFTMNMPGEYKTYPLAHRAFVCGLRLIREQLAAHGVHTQRAEEFDEPTGCEAFFLVAEDAHRVKELMAAIEQGHALGRLFDIDVLAGDGSAVKGAAIGRGERRCIVCGGPVWVCARSRAHTARELALHTAGVIDDYFAGAYADKIAATAVRALLYEVCITPKPGLVDRLGNGAHRDMDIFTFIDSSCALTAYFRDITRSAAAFSGAAQELLPALRFSGQQAERAMLAATGGVNTHKGLIFSMGIVCAALGLLYGEQAPPAAPQALFDACARIAGSAADELPASDSSATYGVAAFRRHGLTGARGEAALGFPSVRRHGYPVLQKWVGCGCSLNDAGVIALLHLMAHVGDTNLVGRSGLASLQTVQERIRPVLREADAPEPLLQLAAELDSELTTAYLSPGGCADLLAVSLMVYFLFDADSVIPD